MTRLSFPLVDMRTLSDDGGEFHFCTTFAFSQVCMSEGMDKRALKDLHVLGFVSLER